MSRWVIRTKIGLRLSWRGRRNMSRNGASASIELKFVVVATIAVVPLGANAEEPSLRSG
jgi:hypothetical protein